MSAIIDPHFKVANGLVDNDLKSAGRNDGRHMKIMAFFLLKQNISIHCHCS